MVDTQAIASLALEIVARRYGRAAAVEPGAIQFVLSDLDQREWHVRREGDACVVAAGGCPSAVLAIETDTPTLAALISNTLGMSMPPPSATLRIEGSLSSLALILHDANPWIDFAHAQYANAEQRVHYAPVDRVERRDAVSTDDIRDHVRRSVPLIVTRAVALRSLTHPTIAAFSERFGSAVLASPTKSGVPAREHFTFIESGKAMQSFGHVLPEEILSDLVWPDGWPLQRLTSHVMFSSSAGAVSAPHRHPNDVVNVQLAGRKLWRLFSPDQTPLLYVRPTTASHQMCQMETTTTESTRFPLLHLARALEVTLEPGDVLVLPTAWYHEVIALDASVSAAFILPAESSTDGRRLPAV